MEGPAPPGTRSSPAPPGRAGRASAASSRRQSIWGTRRTPASWSPLCPPTPSRPGSSTSAYTAHGARWRTRSRSSSWISSPTGPRPPASPPTSSGSSSPPSHRSSSTLSGRRFTAPAWPPRHRRNAPAQAPQDRRPRHRLDSPDEGCHGLGTPFLRSLRTGTRSITRVGPQHLPATCPAPLTGPLRPRTGQSPFSTSISSFPASKNPPGPVLTHSDVPGYPPVTPSTPPLRPPAGLCEKCGLGPEVLSSSAHPAV